MLHISRVACRSIMLPLPFRFDCSVVFLWLLERLQEFSRQHEVWSVTWPATLILACIWYHSYDMCIQLSARSQEKLFVYPPTHLCPSIHEHVPSTHPSIHLSLCLSIHRKVNKIYWRLSESRLVPGACCSASSSFRWRHGFLHLAD